MQKGSIAKAIKSARLNDAADSDFFGRMVTNDYHSLTVEGIGMFSACALHPQGRQRRSISLPPSMTSNSKKTQGAGMTSTLKFNSATYYRFAALKP